MNVSMRQRVAKLETERHKKRSAILMFMGPPGFGASVAAYKAALVAQGLASRSDVIVLVTGAGFEPSAVRLSGTEQQALPTPDTTSLKA
jgi:hypothetical protein